MKVNELAEQQDADDGEQEEESTQSDESEEDEEQQEVLAESQSKAEQLGDTGTHVMSEFQG